MARRSDGKRYEGLEDLNRRTLTHASTTQLHQLLATELLLLEQESGPGGDWRGRLQRVRWCQLLAGELRRRGEQRSLFA